MLLEVFYAFGIVFTVCELSERIINSFEQINDVVHQFEWYLFPVSIQRILPIFIINVHQPIDIAYFGSRSCSREAFKKVRIYRILCVCVVMQSFKYIFIQVVNTGFSYSMMFNQF